jgi:hypothetical protein
MVYGEIVLPDGRVQRMTEVEIVLPDGRVQRMTEVEIGG